MLENVRSFCPVAVVLHGAIVLRRMAPRHTTQHFFAALLERAWIAPFAVKISQNDAKERMHLEAPPHI